MHAPVPIRLLKLRDIDFPTQPHVAVVSRRVGEVNVGIWMKAQHMEVKNSAIIM